MPTILEIGLTTSGGHQRIGELVLADPDEAIDRGAVGSMPGRFPAMVFQYDDEWLRHGFSLGADLPLIEGVQRPVVDPLETDPVLRARGAAFGFVCDHAPGLWVERLFAAAGSTQINALKGDECASLRTAGQLWAAAGHTGHRFGALDLPLTHGNQREFSPLVLDLAKPREAAKTVRELTLAFEFLASGRGLRSTKDLELLLTAATDVGGRSPKTLVALGKKREAAVPGVGTSSQERILRFAPAGDALNPAMVTAVARELAARCGFTPHTKLVTFEEVIADEKLSETTGFAEGSRLTHIMRARSADGMYISTDESFYLSDEVPGLTPDVVRDSVYAYLEGTLGIKIVTSKRTITTEAATESDARYINLGKFNAVGVMRSHTFDADGVMIEYTESRQRPGFFAFHETAIRRNH